MVSVAYRRRAASSGGWGMGVCPVADRGYRHWNWAVRQPHHQRYPRRLGRPTLAQTIYKRHPARGGSHRDRAPRPGPQGPATGRC